MQLRFKGEIDREDDGRWIASVLDIPGVMAYGATKDEAKRKAFAILLDVIADQMTHDEFKVPAQDDQALEVAYA